MYEDKTLVCKDCGKEFTFTAGEQEFYAEKALNTNPRDAETAATPEKARPELQENCSLLSVQDAAAKQKFPSSPAKTDPFIAVTASLR